MAECDDNHDKLPEERPPINNLLRGSLPAGFRPTDADLAELLKRKLESNDTSVFDFYSDSSSPAVWFMTPANENFHDHDDEKMYMFSPKFDPHKDTPMGRWKKKDASVTVINNSQGEELAYKGVFDFFDRFGQVELLTYWQMCEIRLIPKGNLPQDIVLCVVYKTDRPSLVNLGSAPSCPRCYPYYIARPPVYDSSVDECWSVNQ